MKKLIFSLPIDEAQCPGSTRIQARQAMGRDMDTADFGYWVLRQIMCMTVVLASSGCGSNRHSEAASLQKHYTPPKFAMAVGREWKPPKTEWGHINRYDIILPPGSGSPPHNPHGPHGGHVGVILHPNPTKTETLAAYAYNDQTGYGPVVYVTDSKQFLAPDGWAITGISGVLVTTANPKEANANMWQYTYSPITLEPPLKGIRGAMLTAKAGSKNSFGANVWIGVQVTITLTEVPGLHYPSATTVPSKTATSVGMQIVFQGAAQTGGWMQLVNAATGDIYSLAVDPGADPQACVWAASSICDRIGLKYSLIPNGIRIDGKGNQYYGYGLWSTNTDY